MKKILILILMLILFSNLINASDFNIVSVNKLTSNPYKGDFVEYKGIIRADPSNICKIECQFSVGSDSGYVSDSGNSPATQLESEETQEFPFSIRAEGVSGSTTTTITVTCNRVTSIFPPCMSGTVYDSEPVSFSFLYAGDNVCTTSKEKCKSYSTYIGTSDCSCPSYKECRPDGEKNPDSKGCQTYCGNKIYEPEYEDCDCSQDFTCSSTKKCKPNNNRALDKDGCTTYCGNNICEKEYETCSGDDRSTNCNDCKKCDSVSCVKGTECEGGYCVWGFCWHASTKKGDGHCDSGENCGNSDKDCECSKLEQCVSGTCKTWCGNGICESSEVGKCNADCEWCGDGICDKRKESCRGCSLDCGECEKTEEEKVLTEQLVELKVNAEESAEKALNTKMSVNITIGSSLGFILLVGIIWIVYKVISSKKDKKGKSKKNKKKDSKLLCPKCKTPITKKDDFCSKCGKKLK